MAIHLRTLSMLLIAMGIGGLLHAGHTAQLASANQLPALEDQEKALLVSALAKAGDNQSEAARMLRISRDTLRYHLKKHGIKSSH